MKKQSGVTMIELVIVLIIIILIATFSVYTGRESINQSTVTEIYSEMSSMKEIINGINLKKDLDEDFVLTEGVDYDFKVSVLAGTVEEFENAYNIDIDDGDFNDLYIIIGMDDMDKYKVSNVRKNYGLDSIKHSYIINFEKGDVSLLKTINLLNRDVRTFEQVRALVDEGEI